MWVDGYPGSYRLVVGWLRLGARARRRGDGRGAMDTPTRGG